GRREVVGGGMLAGLAAMAAPEEAGASAQEKDDNTAIARAIDNLRQLLERQADSCRLGACGAADAVRAQQKTFLKSNRSFPTTSMPEWMRGASSTTGTSRTASRSTQPDCRMGATVSRSCSRP